MSISSYIARPIAQTAAVATLALLPFVAALFPAAPVRAQMDASLQMPLGNPDKAQSSPTNRDHYLMQRPQFAESYNDTLRFPNWVAWHLSKQDIGDTERGNFAPDPGLPKGFTVVRPSDYNKVGYDRGHNCPAKDRSASVEDSDAVFYMTNMTPQTHGLNAGPWKGLEDYSRDLAGAGNELLIYCGHGFSAPTHQTVGPKKIAVPDFGWKVVVVIPPGTGDLVSRVTPTTRVIAIKVPNVNTVSKKNWRTYRTSVQDIEKATGLAFFDKVPQATADALKARVDFDDSAVSKLPPGPNAFHILTPQKTKIAVAEIGMQESVKADSPRLRLLHKGDEVTILGAQAGHYKIMLADNTYGFVPKNAVEAVEVQ